MAATHRVLVTDKLAEEGLELLRRSPGLEVVVNTKLAGDAVALRAALQDADGIVVRSGTQLTAEILKGQTRLKAIVRAGVGVDNIDVPAATRQGVIVMNTPGGNTVSTAEQTMTLLLGLSRNLYPACASLKAGLWERSKFTGAQLEGKTLGVIGLGRVGRAVAARARGFEMTVVGYDPFLAADKALELGITSFPNLDDLWPLCDYITLHIPYSEDTRNLIGEDQLSRMKPGVRIINCARGGLIDENALIKAIDRGHVAGAAIDVFEPEPPPADLPVIKHPKVLVTPHLGASTEEAQISVAVEAARLLAAYFLRGQVHFSVNMPALDQAEVHDLLPYLDMGRRLGILHAQMKRGTVKALRISYLGDVASKNTQLITSAVAAGWLEAALEEQVNLVNALFLAQERGVAVTEVKCKDSHDFGSVVQVELETESKTYVAAGALFGKQRIRLVGLGPYLLDAHLEGTLLVFTHNDRPGLIGFLGTTLGKHHVNIAQMNVGRQTPGGEAIGVVNLDSVPSEDALADVRKHPDIISITLIKLPPAGDRAPYLPF